VGGSRLDKVNNEIVATTEQMKSQQVMDNKVMTMSTWMRKRSKNWRAKPKKPPRSNKRQMIVKKNTSTQSQRAPPWRPMKMMRTIDLELHLLILALEYTHGERDSKEDEDERARREEAENEQRKEENEMKANPLPLWAVRLVPGCIIDCSTEAVNADTVDGAARVIDVIIMTHVKNR